MKSPTERTQLRRMPERGSRDTEDVQSILQEGFLASVGFCVNGHPFVIPTLYGCEGETLYLHGSAASRMMRELATGVPACVTVVLVDGIVLARSAFHHSMNYRSVVAFGIAKQIDDPQRKVNALRVISEHLVPGRWADVRSPIAKELKATTVLEFAIDEASAKVRNGPPSDDEEDYDFDCWAGVIPLVLSSADPVADPRLRAGVHIPPYATRFNRPTNK